MDFIFILGASQAFFLSILVFSKRGISTGDYVLGTWLAFMGLHLLNYYLDTTGFLLQHPHLLGIGACFPMLQGPFMLVYILVMTNKTGRFRLVYWLHGIPFLFLSMYFLFDFYFLSAAEKITYIELQTINPSPAVVILDLLNEYLGPSYVIWSLFKLSTHMKTIGNSFSNTEKINLNWLKFVLYGLGFVWFIVIVSNTLVHFTVFSEVFSSQLIYISATVAVFFLGFFGLKQQAIYVVNPGLDGNSKDIIPVTDKITVKRYKRSGLTQIEAKEYLTELLDYMEKEKPFLNSNLSLKEVAESLNISINHLSQVINEQLGLNFFNFVNNYRIKEVQSLLLDPENKQYTLLALAYKSGFNSKSSFNNIFKKITGLTPSNFMKQRAA